MRTSKILAPVLIGFIGMSFSSSINVEFEEDFSKQFGDIKFEKVITTIPNENEEIKYKYKISTVDGSFSEIANIPAFDMTKETCNVYTLSDGNLITGKATLKTCLNKVSENTYKASTTILDTNNFTKYYLLRSFESSLAAYDANITVYVDNKDATKIVQHNLPENDLDYILSNYEPITRMVALNYKTKKKDGTYCDVAQGIYITRSGRTNYVTQCGQHLTTEVTFDGVSHININTHLNGNNEVEGIWINN